MLDNLGTLCIIGFIGLIALFLLPRLMNGFGSQYGRRGPLNSEVDDPNIDSSGSFGGGQGGIGTRRPTADDPNISSRGSFGRGIGRSVFSRRGGSSGSGGRADNPNVRSKGGFGRSK
jgi:hypothetical protein